MSMDTGFNVDEEIAIRMMEFVESLDNEVKSMKAEKQEHLRQVNILNSRIQAWETKISQLNLKTELLVPTTVAAPIPEPELVAAPVAAAYQAGIGFVPAVPELEEGDDDSYGNAEASNVSMFRPVVNPSFLEGTNLNGVSWRLRGSNHWKVAGGHKGVIQIGPVEFISLKKSRESVKEACTECNEGRGEDEQPRLIKKGSFYITHFIRSKNTEINNSWVHCEKHVPANMAVEVQDVHNRIHILDSKAS